MRRKPEKKKEKDKNDKIEEEQVLGKRIRKNEIGGKYGKRRFTGMIRITSMSKTENKEDTPKGQESHRREVGWKIAKKGGPYDDLYTKFRMV